MFFLAAIRGVVSQFKCDFLMYGRPKMDDCASTFLAMPDSGVSQVTQRLDTVRRFIEPQFLEPPFSAVKNDMGASMEQLPKFWRYSKSAY